MARTDPLLDSEVRHLLRLVQDGVVSRAQLLDAGAADHDLERMLRRREIAPIHPGVYVTHTGSPTPEQRRWAAVLVHRPASLTRWSAMPNPSPTAVIEVAVDPGRTIGRRITGLRVHRTADCGARTDPRSAPPRIRLEHAAIDLAAEAIGRDDLNAAVGVLSRACGSRRTTAAQVAAVLADRSRVPGRRVLAALLDDLATGSASVIEHGYLVRVERAHGLPPSDRQVPGPLTAAGSATFRDVRYRRYGVVVELDGRTHHGSAAAWEADHERDLDAAAVDGDVTLRLTYRQVFGHGCRTAERVGRVLRRRGWRGPLDACLRCAA